MRLMQATLKREVRLSGIGVHSGKETVLRLLPAPVNHGIVFMRRDSGGAPVFFPAQAAYSLPADLCTVLTAAPPAAAGENAAPARPPAAGRLEVATIEHVMAALAGLGVDNALAELSAAEVPILDGSAAPFARAIMAAGVEEQEAKRRYLRILQPARASREGSGAFAEFLPADGQSAKAPEQRFDIEIAFAAAAIGRQRLRFALTPRFFIDNLASARTFGFLSDAEKLRAQGLALGASLENSVVIDKEGKVLNPQALSAPDAFVRHKALDAAGDTALLGMPFIGLFRSCRSGHKLNAAALAALLSDRRAYEIIEL